MGLRFVLSLSDSSCEDSPFAPDDVVGRACRDNLRSCAIPLLVTADLVVDAEDLRSGSEGVCPFNAGTGSLLTAGLGFITADVPFCSAVSCRCICVAADDV